MPTPEPTVHEHVLSRLQSGAVRIAPWAVMKTSGNPPASNEVQLARARAQCTAGHHQLFRLRFHQPRSRKTLSPTVRKSPPRRAP